LTGYPFDEETTYQYMIWEYKAFLTNVPFCLSKRGWTRS